MYLMLEAQDATAATAQCSSRAIMRRAETTEPDSAVVAQELKRLLLQDSDTAQQLQGGARRSLFYVLVTANEFLPRYAPPPGQHPATRPDPRPPPRSSSPGQPRAHSRS